MAEELGWWCMLGSVKGEGKVVGQGNGLGRWRWVWFPVSNCFLFFFFFYRSSARLSRMHSGVGIEAHGEGWCYVGQVSFL